VSDERGKKPGWAGRNDEGADDENDVEAHKKPGWAGMNDEGTDDGDDEVEAHIKNLTR
jgi:hypothetical protein